MDGNPFQGPWKALVEPLLAKTPMTPLYPPSTPIFPPPSASIRSGTETDVEEDVPSDMDRPSTQVTEDEDTIMPSRASQLSRAVAAPHPHSGTSAAVAPPLQRTRTTPNRAYHERTRAVSRTGADGNPVPSTSKALSGSSTPSEREVRKMKSAGELRRNHAISVAASMQGSTSATSSPQRPTAMSQYVTSASSSNLLSLGSPTEEQKSMRFASLGVSSGMMSPGGTKTRPTVDHSIWDNISGDEGESSSHAHAVLRKRSPTMPSRAPSTRSPPKSRESQYSQIESIRPKEEKDKSNRWGFLKKMSMGKMRAAAEGPAPRPSTSQGRPPPQRIVRMPSDGDNPRASGVTGTPKIDVRISTTGALDGLPPSLSKKPSIDHLKVTPPPPIPEDSPESSKPPTPILPTQPTTAGNLLGVPTPTPRAAKRRSFLPIDVSPIPVPAPAPFLPNVTATNGDVEEGQDALRISVNTIPHDTMEQLQRREEEKAREARQRALRSVMAYLRDMHDLGLSQTNVLSMYGGPAPGAQGDGLRSRRPTVIENGQASLSSSTSSMVSRPDSTLRNSEARYGMRSGNSTQTNSVATTDSNGSGSGEERKFKDDKGKRARVVREIVEYVLHHIFLRHNFLFMILLSGLSGHT